MRRKNTSKAPNYAEPRHIYPVLFFSPQDHVWAVSVSLVGPTEARILGTSTTTFNSSSQKASFDQLGITVIGTHNLKIDVTSSNREYVLVAYTIVKVKSLDGGDGSSNSGGSPVSTGFKTKKLQMQFDADFATIVGEQEDIFIENFKRQMETLFDDTKVFITDVTVEEGNTPTPAANT